MTQQKHIMSEVRVILTNCVDWKNQYIVRLSTERRDSVNRMMCNGNRRN